MWSNQCLIHENLKKYLWLILVFLLTVVLIQGCSIKDKTPAGESNLDGETAPDTYRFTLWEGGGFTGLTTGFSLSADGRVTHWQRFKGQADSVLWTEEGHAAPIDTLRIQLEESGALEMQYNESGNMTAGITYEHTDKKYLWTWKHTGSADEVPEPLRSWRQKAIDFCQSLYQK